MKIDQINQAAINECINDIILTTYNHPCCSCSVVALPNVIALLDVGFSESNSGSCYEGKLEHSLPSCHEKKSEHSLASLPHESVSYFLGHELVLMHKFCSRSICLTHKESSRRPVESQRCQHNFGHLLTDSSTSDTDGKSICSDSESEFDLSNPEAGVATNEDELFVSQTDEAAICK